MPGSLLDPLWHLMGYSDQTVGSLPAASPPPKPRSSQRAAPSRVQRTAPPPPPERSWWDQASDAYQDAAQRSWVGAGVRKFASLTGMYRRPGESQEDYDARIALAEKNRRAQYAERSRNDSGWATVPGAVAGGVDPTYLYAPGGSLATRLAAQGGMQAVSSLGRQEVEREQGIRTKVDPREAYMSGMEGVLGQGAIEGLGHVGGKVLSRVRGRPDVEVPGAGDDLYEPMPQRRATDTAGPNGEASVSVSPYTEKDFNGHTYREYAAHNDAGDLLHQGIVYDDGMLIGDHADGSPVNDPNTGDYVRRAAGRAERLENLQEGTPTDPTVSDGSAEGRPEHPDIEEMWQQGPKDELPPQQPVANYNPDNFVQPTISASGKLTHEVTAEANGTRQIYAEYAPDGQSAPTPMQITIDPEGKATLNINTGKIDDASAHAGSLGRASVKEGLNEVLREFPEITEISGIRKVGDRVGRFEREQKIPASVVNRMRSKLGTDEVPQAAAPVEAPASVVPEGLDPETHGKISDAIEMARGNRAAQDAGYKAVRNERLKASAEAAEGLEGEHEARARMSALKGELPKVKGDDLSGVFSQEERDALFSQISSSPRLRGPYEPIRAYKGLMKLLEGDTPAPSELEPLSRALSVEDLDKLVTQAKQGGYARKGQGEMFPQSETLATGPLRGDLAPEPKPVDPDKFTVPKGQGDLFRDEKSFTEPARKAAAAEARAAARAQAKAEKATSPQEEHSNFTRLLLNFGGLARPIQSSLDLSFPFRQGIGAIHTKAFWKSFGPMIRALRSKEAYENMAHAILEDEYFPAAKAAGVDFADIGHNLANRDESFQSQWADNIPIVAGTGRAHTMFGNKLRMDLFKDMYKKSVAAFGEDFAEQNPKLLTDLGKVVNNMSSRAALPKKASQYSPFLNLLFYSTRMMYSRLQSLNPAYYLNLSPLARKEAMKSAVATVAYVYGMSRLGKAAGFDVEDDPRSSTFMQVVHGDFHHDFAGGFAPMITYIARMLTGTTKGQDGVVKDLSETYATKNRGDLSLRFLRSKLAPVPSAIVDFAQGKDYLGQPATIPHELANHVIPFFPATAKDAYDKNGVEGVAESIPSMFGTGLNIYSGIPPAPTSMKVGKETIELNEEAQAKYQSMVQSYLEENIKVLQQEGDWDKFNEDERKQVTAQIIKDGKKQAKRDLFDTGNGPEPEEVSATYNGPKPGRQLFDGFSGIPTSIRRTEAGNRRVGGVAHSSHLEGDAIDFVPAPGQSMKELEAEAHRYFGNTYILNEGDHVHVRIPGFHGPLFGNQGSK